MRDMKARRIMKKIKNNYTNFILTMIAVALFGINYHLFSGDIISEPLFPIVTSIKTL